MWLPHWIHLLAKFYFPVLIYEIIIYEIIIFRKFEIFQGKRLHVVTEIIYL